MKKSSNNLTIDTSNYIILISSKNRSNQTLLAPSYEKNLNFTENKNATSKPTRQKPRQSNSNKRFPQTQNKINKVENYDSFKEKPSAKFHSIKFANPFSPQKTNRTIFGSVYINNGIPCHLIHGTANLFLKWDKPFDKINYSKVLPECFVGIIETEHPYKFVARQACKELLLADNAYEKTVPLLPKLFQSLRAAFSYIDDKELFYDACDITEILIKLVKEKANMHLGFILLEINAGYTKLEYRERVFNLLRCIELYGGKEATGIIVDKVPAYYCSIK